MSQPATVAYVDQRTDLSDGKGNALTIRIGDSHLVITVRRYLDEPFPDWVVRPDRPRTGRRPPPDPSRRRYLMAGAPLDVDSHKIMFGRVQVPDQIRLLDGQVIWPAPAGAETESARQTLRRMVPRRQGLRTPRRGRRSGYEPNRPA